MDRLQKWFGGGEHKSSEQKSVNTDVVLVDRNDATTKHVKSTQPTATQESSAASSQKLQLDSPSDASITETRVGQLMQQGRQMILRVVPLTEGDCLSCKLIGSGVMFGAAAFVLLSYPKVKSRYTGIRSGLFVLQVGTLSSSLMLLGTARLFDLSIFSPPDAEGKKKTLVQLLEEEMDSFKKFSSRIFPTNGGSDAKKDS